MWRRWDISLSVIERYWCIQNVGATQYDLCLIKICLVAMAMGSGKVRENTAVVLHKICASCLDKSILRAESKGLKYILAIKGERNIICNDS